MPSSPLFPRFVLFLCVCVFWFRLCFGEMSENVVRGLPLFFPACRLVKCPSFCPVVSDGHVQFEPRLCSGLPAPNPSAQVPGVEGHRDAGDPESDNCCGGGLLRRNQTLFCPKDTWEDVGCFYNGNMATQSFWFPKIPCKRGPPFREISKWETLFQE